jgi:hypothetical protein
MTTKQGALQSAVLTEYYLGDKIRKNGMGWTCGRYGGVKRSIQGFGWETREKDIT